MTNTTIGSPANNRFKGGRASRMSMAAVRLHAVDSSNSVNSSMNSGYMGGKSVGYPNTSSITASPAAHADGSKSSKVYFRQPVVNFGKTVKIGSLQRMKIEVCNESNEMVSQ